MMSVFCHVGMGMSTEEVEVMRSNDAKVMLYSLESHESFSQAVQ